MRELHDQHARAREEIAALEAAAETAAHDRRTAEAAAADAQAKLKRYQQQINAVTTQREYGALLHEIDTVKAQIAQHEEAGLAALDRAESAQADLAARREAFQDLDRRYGEELERWEAEKPAVAREVQALTEEIQTLRGRLSRGVLAQFDRIRERYPAGALAAVRRIERGPRGPQEWHCGACNYRVRPQVVVEIRNAGTLVECDSCKRILYLAAEAG
jgi:predicted  nucleic acid-binding Zn-ribbon protein